MICLLHTKTILLLLIFYFFIIYFLHNLYILEEKGFLVTLFPEN